MWASRDKLPVQSTLSSWLCPELQTFPLVCELHDQCAWLHSEWRRNKGMFSKESTAAAWTEENHHVKIPQGFFLVQGRPGSKCDLVLGASLYKSWCLQGVPFWRTAVSSSGDLAHYWNFHMHFIHRVMMISSYPTLFPPGSCSSCPVAIKSKSHYYAHKEIDGNLRGTVLGAINLLTEVLCSHRQGGMSKHTITNSMELAKDEDEALPDRIRSLNVKHLQA